MFLQPCQLIGGQASDIHPAIHVAIEGQHRGSGIAGIEARPPGLVACHIELRQFVAQPHQAGDLLRRFLAQQRNQFGGLLHKQWLAVRHFGQRTLVVQRFSG